MAHHVGHKLSTNSKQILVSLLLGFTGVVVASVLISRDDHLIATAQVGVSDAMMLRPNGPRLGERAARDDIVLVLFDAKSAKELGYVHSYPADLEVYVKLIKSGASVVFDTRMVAIATPVAFEEARPLLEGMVGIANTGKLMRDVWLSSELEVQNGARLADVRTQNIINSHPHDYPSVTSRLYPLTYFDASGVHESAPLTICRRVWSEPRPSVAEVGEELRRSGIMSKWHEFSPDAVPKTEIPSSDYRIGSHKIAWHSFRSASLLVPPAAFWVSYDPPMSAFQRFSYVDILRGEVLEGLRDKVVLVGYSADIDPSSDTYSVPSLLNKASAAEVVACATQTLLDNHTMRVFPRSLSSVQAAILILAIALICGLFKPIQAIIGTVLSLLLYFTVAVISYRSGWYSDFVVAPTAGLLVGIPCGATSAWFGLRARQRVVELFGRYVPRAIVDQLMLRSDMESLTLGGTKREVTVMFADIRGFTDFAQDLPPEEVVDQLNSLLKVMVDCTFENEGTLDKFIGDAILVLFNAPLDQSDHTLRAVQTAVSIQNRLSGHLSGLHVGIGIHRGEAVVGNIGTPQRMEYTAIGSTVNIASRLCDLAQPGDVVVSQSVLQHVSAAVNAEPLGPVNIKGIRSAMSVYRIGKSL